MGGIQDQERLYLVQPSKRPTKQCRKARPSIQNLDGSLTIVVMPAFGGA